MDMIDLKSQYQAGRARIDARIHSVLEHGQYIMGPEVQELEQRLAAYTGAAHCITVASGTEALLISLMALGIKAGDEVITTPFSFIATAEAIALLGATPVFVDIDGAICNIDPALIAPAITARTRAIIPVSLYGQVADMAAINAIAAEYGIAVIEDGAQSFGADYRGKKSCNLSTIGCTSFFPSKPLGCYGDGGAIFTSDATLATAMREIRVHGQSHRYHHTRVGVGGRMDTLQCAIVLAKLDDFAHELTLRQQFGARYRRHFAGRVKTVQQRPDRNSVHAQFTILVEQREQVQARLQSAGIPTAIHYPLPMHRQPAYRDLCRYGPCPIAEAMAERVLSLPMGPYLGDDGVDRVATAVLAAIEESAAVTPL